MTPFEKAGYTHETRFRVLRDRSGIKKNEIVRLCFDDGSKHPYFVTEDVRFEYCLWLPGEGLNGKEELEVYKGD